MHPTYDATMESVLTAILLLLYIGIGYAIPAFLTYIGPHAEAKQSKRKATVAVLVIGGIVLFVPGIAMAAPWYERDPFVMPIGYLLTGAAVAAAAWLGGLFAKGQKADIANANQALAESLESQLRGLMLQAVSAVEERAAAHPLTYKSKDKRVEARAVFRASLPKGVNPSSEKIDAMLDATLALSGKFGATARKG
jgi:hypothetical protein